MGYEKPKNINTSLKMIHALGTFNFTRDTRSYMILGITFIFVHAQEGGRL